MQLQGRTRKSAFRIEKELILDDNTQSSSERDKIVHAKGQLVCEDICRSGSWVCCNDCYFRSDQEMTKLIVVAQVSAQ